jgi:N-acetylglutamate synthase-like GNAT family acetyltransferase
MTIRKCTGADIGEIFRVINDAAQAYRGVIPEDRWHEPYMGHDELEREIADGVVFWGVEEEQGLTGVMGIQDKEDVCLMRHAYVMTSRRRKGVGARLLRHLETLTDKPVLIGTWVAATWAVNFYAKNGYRALSRAESEALLRKYWHIPERQVETSVVLVNAKWNTGD